MEAASNARIVPNKAPIPDDSSFELNLSRARMSGSVEVNSAAWHAIANPGHEHSQAAFNLLLRRRQMPRVLNCAVPLNRALQLTQFELPDGVSHQDCITASVRGVFPLSLQQWRYVPQIRAEAQLPQMKALPVQAKHLATLPWFDSVGQSASLGLNARHIRYHYGLWQEMRPKTIRGMQTTLVLGLPQIGYALTPHIQLHKSFLILGSLARALAPVQLFPAQYLYPDANLGHFSLAPAPMFADILPATCGFSYPVVDCEPDPWRLLCRFGNGDRYYGYPFRRVVAAESDVFADGCDTGAMLLPSGRRVTARASQSRAYATLDPDLHREMRMDREEFEQYTAMVRGTVTHDGLPFQLPIEMQSHVLAVILHTWTLVLDRAGDLSSYTIATDHAAIRGFHFYQRVEPFFSNFFRLIVDVSRDPGFCTYPLTNHLTHSWLGRNLCLANQLSESEAELGAELMRAYYHQQLDWQCGVTNLMNHGAFRLTNGRTRSPEELERALNPDGLVFHQMQRTLRFDSHLFHRPLKRASFWPRHHPGFLELDRQFLTEQLPKL